MTEDAEYGLVMPFLPVTSRGGPFDDDAYVAGYQMGKLDEKLGSASASGRLAGGDVTIRSANRAQADLIAMRHGFTTQVEDAHDGWTQLRFQARPEQEEVPGG